jgi:hypothetical protein
MFIYCQHYGIFITIIEKENNMGIHSMPWYGYDLGSAIESAEKSIAKIKTNRFDKSDLEKFRASLVSIVSELDKAIANEE